MFVRVTYRGRGLSRVLLQRIEQEAELLGYSRILMERTVWLTGTGGRLPRHARDNGPRLESLRRVRDLNPRTLSRLPLSRRVHSAALPTLRLRGHCAPLAVVEEQVYPGPLSRVGLPGRKLREALRQRHPRTPVERFARSPLVEPVRSSELLSKKVRHRRFSAPPALLPRPFDDPTKRFRGRNRNRARRFRNAMGTTDASQ